MVEAAMVIIRIIIALFLCVNSAYAVPTDGRSMTQVLDISKEAYGNYRNVRSTDDAEIRLVAVTSAYANRPGALAKRVEDAQSVKSGKLVLYRAIYADGVSEDVVVYNPLSSIPLKFHSEKIVLPFLMDREPAQLVTLPSRLIDAYVVDETGYWRDWSITVCQGTDCTIRYGSTWHSTGYTFLRYDRYGGDINALIESSSDFRNQLSNMGLMGEAPALGGSAIKEFFRIMNKIFALYTIHVYDQ